MSELNVLNVTKVKISMGNSKQGNIPSVSLPPIKSCRKCNLPCSGECYALRMYKQYDNVRKAYDNNWEFLNNDFNGYFNDIIEFLTNDVCMGFRWHVSGDIPTLEYFDRMVMIARMFPHKQFLAFTKQYEIVNSWCDESGVESIPNNLNVIFSEWEGLELINPYMFPVSKFYPIETIEEFNDIEEEPQDGYTVKNAKCNGNCSYCLSHRVNCYWTKVYLMSGFCGGYTVNFLEHGTPKANAYWRKVKKSQK